MKQAGRLIILEGPDGVGKTTIALALTEYLRSQNLPTEYRAFPGKEKGTLGYLIYDLHHNLKKYGINSIVAASLQLLHVAAHVDEIENRLLPILKAGYYLILDRYWWSTWVYGSVFGANSTILSKMIDVELSAWGRIYPNCVILIDRTSSFRTDELGDQWKKIRLAYHKLLTKEIKHYPAEVVKNDKCIDDAVQQVFRILSKYGISYYEKRKVR